MKYVLLLILLILLIPFGLVCFYSFPFADDFCFGWTASANTSLLQKILDQYLYWNGRYTSDALVQFHPLLTGQIRILQSTLLVAILLTPVALFLLLKEIINNNYYALVVALVITLFFFNYQPEITEELYWFIGMVNYHAANLCITLQLALLLKSISMKGRAKYFLQLLSLIITFTAVGFNEIGAVWLIFLYFSLLYLTRKSSYEVRVLVGLHLVVTLLGCVFVFSAPGNLVRSANFPDRHQLLHSLFYSSLQTIRFLATWSFSIPFFTLSAVLLSLRQSIFKEWIQKLDYRTLLSCMIFTVFIGSFLPYFATGLLGQHRTIDFAFFLFIPLYVLFLSSAARKFETAEKIRTLITPERKMLLIVITIIGFVCSGNWKKISSDFQTGTFKKYELAFFARQSKILQNPDAPIYPLSPVPVTFKIADTKSDTSYWADKCMRNFYIESGVILAK